MNRDVDELLAVLLNSTNGAWQDDAAEDLAKCSDHDRAQAALLTAINSPKLDESLRRTCAESLAEIWITRGRADVAVLRQLNGMPRKVAEACLRSANLRFER